MKRYVAHLKLEIDSESAESAEYLAKMQASAINRRKPGVGFPDIGAAELRRATVTRFRARKRR